MITRKIVFILPESVAINRINEFVPFISTRISEYYDLPVDIVIPRTPDNINFTHSKHIYYGIHSIGQYYSVDQLTFDNATRRGCRVLDNNHEFTPYKANPSLRVEFLEPPVYDYVGYSTIRNQFVDKQPDYSYSFALRIDLLGNLIGKSIALQRTDSMNYNPPILNKDAAFHCIQQSAIKFYNCRIVSADFTKLYNAQYFKDRAKNELRLTVLGLQDIPLPALNDDVLRSSRNSSNPVDDDEIPLFKILLKIIIRTLEEHNVISKYSKEPEDYRHKLNADIWNDKNSTIKLINSGFNGSGEDRDFAKYNLFLFLFSSVLSHYMFFVAEDFVSGNIDTSELYTYLPPYFKLGVSDAIIKIYLITNSFPISSSAIFYEIKKLIIMPNFGRASYPNIEILKNNQNLEVLYNKVNLKSSLREDTASYSKSALTSAVNNFLINQNLLDKILNTDLKILISINLHEVLIQLANHFILDDIVFDKDYLMHLENELDFDLHYNLAYLMDDKDTHTNGRLSSKFPRNQILQIVRGNLARSNMCHLKDEEEYSLMFLRNLEIDDNVINDIYNDSLQKMFQIMNSLSREKGIQFTKYFDKIVLTDESFYIIGNNAISRYEEIIEKLQDGQIFGSVDIFTMHQKEQLRIFTQVYLYYDKWITDFKPLTNYYAKFLELYSQRLSEDLFIREEDIVDNANLIIESKLRSVAMQAINSEKKYIYEDKIILNNDTKTAVGKWISANETSGRPNNIDAIDGYLAQLIKSDFKTFVEKYFLLMRKLDSKIQYLIRIKREELEITKNLEQFMSKIFIDEKNVPFEPIPPKPIEPFVPNTLGTIIQTEPLYSYIEFEVEDGTGDKYQQSDDKKSEIVFSSSLRTIKHFRGIYDGMISQNSTAITAENPNLEFLDDVYIPSSRNLS